jgi:Tfp pilus assembly protein PilF
MGRKAEAEQCLREGLKHNPNSHEILFELGRCYYERDDLDRARNLWEVGTRRWIEQESAKPADDRNVLAGGMLLNHLARLEARAGNRDQAVHWLTILKKFSPEPAEIEKRIQEARLGKLTELK